MTEKDKKDTRLIVVEAIQALVIPRFEEIDKRFDDIDKKFEKTEEDLEFLKDSNTRIELSQKSEVGRNDDQDVKMSSLDSRVLKLEKSKA